MSRTKNRPPARPVCSMGDCQAPAVVRAWYGRPCGHTDHVSPVCLSHDDVAGRPTACPECGDVSRLKVTKKKALPGVQRER